MDEGRDLRFPAQQVPERRDDDEGLFKFRQLPPDHWARDFERRRIAEGLAQMERNQIESGFDPEAEGRKVLAAWRAKQAAERNEPAEPPSAEEIEAIVAGFAAWRGVPVPKIKRVVTADGDGPARRDDSADDADDEVARFETKKKPPEDPPTPEDEEAEQEPKVKAKRRLSVTDFVAHSPDHTYIHRSTGEPWTSTAVNSRVRPIKIGGGKNPLAASTWLDRNDAVEQRVWAPGEPQIIENRLVAEGGFFAKKNARVFNLYKPPQIVRATDDDVSFWQSHLQELWPDQADHIERWFAHRAQRPGEKINHALVLGGAPGIGKDAVIEPLRRAVGSWNLAEISPTAVLGNFNEFARSVVLRISEGKDLGDFDRFTFYEATKTLMAAPPDTLRCNPKFIKPYYVLNVTGVIVTTNHKVGGLFLPADDRRHFVAWSTREMNDFSPAYWAKYWARLNTGGADAVAKHLRTLDLKGFDPKAPPERTQAFLEMVDAMRSEEEGDMADTIESLGNPKALMVADLIDNAEIHQRFRFAEFLKDPAKRRAVVIRLEDCGYRRLDNPDDKRGRWKIGSQRGSVYVPRQLPDRDGFAAIRDRGGR
jgi:hypothetical protein